MSSVTAAVRSLRLVKPSPLNQLSRRSIQSNSSQLLRRAAQLPNQLSRRSIQSNSSQLSRRAAQLPNQFARRSMNAKGGKTELSLDTVTKALGSLSETNARKPLMIFVGGCTAYWIMSNSVLFTDAGMIYVVQNNLTGTLDVFTEPGMHRRVPFFSTVTAYKAVVTSQFESGVKARFADTYVGIVPVAFRFKLPNEPEQVRKLHREFRSEGNLTNTLLNRNAQNVTVITATQYTGEEFFQGGLNQFKNQLADQLQNGVYKTERRQVEVEQTELAPVGFDQSDSKALKRSKQLVWKTVPLFDESGDIQRSENPLGQYGIEVTQVLIGDPKPEDQLEKLLMDKKRLVAERIKTVQEQETSKAQAKTEQLKKEIQRTKEVQDAQRSKELAVITQQKEVEVAKQIAEREVIEQKKLQELATIQKQKELSIAQSELGIQKANSDAAVFAAKAIAAKGKAEAEVLQAQYRAKAQNKEVFLAEVERDIAREIYSNLKDFKIEMPHNYIGGGDGVPGKLTSNLDVITGLSALGLMDKAKAMRK